MSTHFLDELADLVLGRTSTESVPAAVGFVAGTFLASIAGDLQAKSLLQSRRFTEPRFPQLTYALSEQPQDKSFLRQIRFHTPESIPPVIHEKYPSGDITEYTQRTQPLESEIKPPPMEQRIFLGRSAELPTHIPEPIFFQLSKQVAENRIRSLHTGGEMGEWYKAFGPFAIPSENIVTVSYSEDPGVIAHELGHVRGAHEVGSWFYPTIFFVQAASSILPYVAAAVRALGPNAEFPEVLRSFVATAILSSIPRLAAYEIGEWDASIRGKAMLDRLKMQRGKDYYEKPSSGFWIRMSPTYPIVGFLIGRAIGYIMARSQKS